jgi:peptidoglycan/xylan/chitin deacetylase (PgdA/CDA1 family)
LYHRIAEPVVDPHDLCVSAKHFGEHLEQLRRHYQIIGLQNLTRALSQGEVPHRAVVLTFDDGYADNAIGARPLLERYDAPASVFVTTGYVGQQHEFWWDELERLLLWPSSVPDLLEVTLTGKTHRWQLQPHQFVPAVRRSLRAGVYRASDDCLSARRRAYRDLYFLLQPLRCKDCEHVMTKLRAQLSHSPQQPVDCRPMAEEEVRQLDACELFDIGAHTTTHPVLAALPEGEQREEIKGSKEALEVLLGHQVNAFSFPYGGQAAIGTQSPRFVREIGFEAACTAAPMPVTSGADLFTLPRFAVRDWSGEEFLHQLGSFFWA